MRSDKHFGFTLVELVIVVAIVAILAAIAYPSYQDSVRETRRAEGKALLFEAAQAQERHFTVFNQYGTNIIGGGVETDANIILQTNSDNGYYTLSLQNPNALTYTLRVTPQVADPDCGFLELDQLGEGTSEIVNPECW